MADISYTPSFHNIDFVDGEDRVKAEGPNGFNERFGAVESDLRQLSTVVAEIGTRLDQLESPPSVTRRLTLPLRFLPGDSSTGWLSSSVGAEAPPQSSTVGVMNLVLPDGVRAVSLRAVGRAPGISIRFFLSRFPIAEDSSSDDLANFTVTTDPFDVTAPIDAAVGRIDTGTFAYRIRALALGGPTNPVTVITGLQLSITD